MLIKNTLRLMLLSLLLIVLSTVSGLSAVPMLINYQGHMTDSSGTPISGSQWVDFSLYTDEIGGTLLWNEQQTVEVTDGIFSVQLGAGNPLESGYFLTPSVYLEITIHITGTEWEVLAPRQRLTSTAFSMKAGNADALEGNTLNDLDTRYVNEGTSVITSVMITDNAIQSEDLSDNSVGASEIAPNSVGTSEVVDNSLTANDLATGSVTSNEIMDNTITAADLSVNSVGTNALAPNSVQTTHLQGGAALAEILDDDGSGSGLDADMVDGKQAYEFAAATHDHVGVAWTANIAWSQGAFKVSNFGNGPTIWGWNGGGGNGIRGYALASGLGVYGESVDNAGVMGRSTNGNGVEGYGGSGNYDFYAGGAGSNYGPFTGSHEVILDENFPLEVIPGTIVAVTGNAKIRFKKDGSISLSSTLPKVKLSSVENDKTVLGALVSENPLPKDHWYKFKDGERFAIINALGEGRVWVTNINGDIEAGDFITSSDIPGYGQMQEDDLMHSYTVGKAIETVDWDTVEETVEHAGQQFKTYLIAVVYTSG